MGKGIEDAIISHVIKKINNTNIYMRPIPSERNLPIQEFCKKVSPNGIINKENSCPKYIKIFNKLGLFKEDFLLIFKFLF